MSKKDDLIIFPFDKFSAYFEISAVYRKKKSGSAEPNELNNLDEIKQGIINENIDGILEFQKINSKNRCFLHSNKLLHNQKIYCDIYNYQFKDNKYSKTLPKKKNYVYEIRRLSNTNNPNVICKLSLKKNNQDNDDLIAFESFINYTEE